MIKNEIEKILADLRVCIKANKIFTRVSGFITISRHINSYV